MEAATSCAPSSSRSPTCAPRPPTAPGAGQPGAAVLAGKPGRAAHQPGELPGRSARPASGMTAREKDSHAATGGGPGGAADAGERNLAPATAVRRTGAGIGRPARGRVAPARERPRPRGGRGHLHRRHRGGEGHAARRAHPVDRRARNAAGRGLRRRRSRCPACAASCWPRHPGRPAAGDLRARRAGLRARHGAAHRPGDRPGGRRHGDAARRAARKVRLEIEPLPPVLTPREAHARAKLSCCRR